MADHLWEKLRYVRLPACQDLCGEDTRRCLSDTAERDTGRWSEQGWCETPDPNRSSTEAVWHSNTEQRKDVKKGLVLSQSCDLRLSVMFKLNLQAAVIHSKIKVTPCDYLWSHDISKLSDMDFDHLGYFTQHSLTISTHILMEVVLCRMIREQ